MIPAVTIKKGFLGLGIAVLLWAVGYHFIVNSRERALASVLIAEAGGEGKAGMEAVAEVILNRSEHTGKSIMRTVEKPKAFSCLNGKSMRRLKSSARRHPRYKEALTIARTVMHHPNKLPRRLHGADHYARSDIHPAWAEGNEPVAVVGHHKFWKVGA
jgi:N-acetylmuramoyl-L-alanine amidase